MSRRFGKAAGQSSADRRSSHHVLVHGSGSGLAAVLVPARRRDGSEREDTRRRVQTRVNGQPVLDVGGVLLDAVREDEDIIEVHNDKLIDELS